MDLPEMNSGDASDWHDLLQNVSADGISARSNDLAGKRVLITGAGGSIGSALAHAVHASRPASLVLLDSSENGLYEIDRSLNEHGSRNHVSVLGSVCDHDRLADLFEGHWPQVILHAAALKHVPLMEHNPFAAIENNAVGTYTLATTAAAFHTDDLILVSTDKAADPASIMGVSKRIAEIVLLALGATARTRMIAVRLGNVIGSQGSVLPLFCDQIARGGPLTVTHRDAKRYFITIDHAVRILFSALESSSSPAILVPDLGQPLRILDLARHLMESHGSSAEIRFTGLRPGDKMTETLLSSTEHWSAAAAADRGGLRQIEGAIPALAIVEAAIVELQSAARRCDLKGLLQIVAFLVPGYRPSEIIVPAGIPNAEIEAIR